MFVLIHNNQVHLGPMNWNSRMFQHYITDELEIVFNVPISNDASAPITIDSVTSIIPVTTTTMPNYNTKIEQLAGPFYTITPTEALVEYTINPKDIEAVKNELKIIIANNRWKKETGGIQITIQNQMLNITTERGSRDIYLQALQLNADGNVWKMQAVQQGGPVVDAWLTLSLTDLQSIVTAIVTHVQSMFTWESTKVSEIDAATTLQELDLITLE